jgi:predicted transcriptional regulator
LVKDAALRLLEDDARFRVGVRRGIGEADRGDLVDEDEVNARIARMK